MRERSLRMSLPVLGAAGEAFDALSRFRVEFYECPYARREALSELTDAVLCADGPVKTLVEQLAPQTPPPPQPTPTTGSHRHAGATHQTSQQTP